MMEDCDGRVLFFSRQDFRYQGATVRIHSEMSVGVVDDVVDGANVSWCSKRSDGCVKE